jgi:hypothetical protein
MSACRSNFEVSCMIHIHCKSWHIIADGSAIDRPVHVIDDVALSQVVSSQLSVISYVNGVLLPFTRVSYGRRNDDQKNSSVYQERVNHLAVVNRLRYDGEERCCCCCKLARSRTSRTSLQLFSSFIVSYVDSVMNAFFYVDELWFHETDASLPPGYRQPPTRLSPTDRQPLYTIHKTKLQNA